MRNSFSTLSAIVVTLGLIGTTAVEAHPPGHSHCPSNRGNSWQPGPCCRHSRIRYSERRWSDRCNCYCYYCPDDDSWDYWSERDTCYYPKNMFPRGLPSGGAKADTSIATTTGGTTSPNGPAPATDKPNSPPDGDGSPAPSTSQGGGDGGL